MYFVKCMINILINCLKFYFKQKMAYRYVIVSTTDDEPSLF